MKVYEDPEIVLRLMEYHGIQDYEEPWVQRFHYLASRGYRLDDRYDPGHIPSWFTRTVEELEDIAETDPSMGKFYRAHPDALADFPGKRSQVKEATRTLDGRQVFLKIIPEDTAELAALRLLSSSPLSNDPDNPAAQLLDYFPVSSDDEISQGETGRSYVFVVLPLLREWDWPPHSMVGETLPFIEQVLRGLSFLHRHNIAHGDIRSSNIMMDPSQLFPRGMHPKENIAIDYGFSFRDEQAHDRVDVDTRYLFTDFGSSSIFSDGTRGLLQGIGRRSLYFAPESRSTPGGTMPWYDPFMADIYQLGCFLEEFFTEPIPELTPLIQSMLHPDPSMRPTAHASLHSFLEISARLQLQVRPRAFLRFMPSKWEVVCAESWLPSYMRYVHFRQVATYMRLALKCADPHCDRARSEDALNPPATTHTNTRARRHSAAGPQAVQITSRPRLRPRATTI